MSSSEFSEEEKKYNKKRDKFKNEKNFDMTLSISKKFVK